MTQKSADLLNGQSTVCKNANKNGYRELLWLIYR